MFVDEHRSAPLIGQPRSCTFAQMSEQPVRLCNLKRETIGHWLIDAPFTRLSTFKYPEPKLIGYGLPEVLAVGESFTNHPNGSGTMGIFIIDESNGISGRLMATTLIA